MFAINLDQCYPLGLAFILRNPQLFAIAVDRM